MRKIYISIIALFLFSSILVSAENICQFASSAQATSENPGSIANYATGS